MADFQSFLLKSMHSIGLQEDSSSIDSNTSINTADTKSNDSISCKIKTFNGKISNNINLSSKNALNNKNSTDQAEQLIKKTNLIEELENHIKIKERKANQEIKTTSKQPVKHIENISLNHVDNSNSKVSVIYSNKDNDQKQTKLQSPNCDIKTSDNDKDVSKLSISKTADEKLKNNDILNQSLISNSIGNISISTAETCLSSLPNSNSTILE